MTEGLRPLLPHPTLSASAAALAPADREVQVILGLDAYHHLREVEYGSKAHSMRWLPAQMWEGCRGALLFWVGELCRQMPQDAPEVVRWRQAWCEAYRRREMAVGPLPWWLGRREFHRACQSQLIKMDPLHYGHQFVRTPLDLAYWMPIGENEWQTL